MKHYLLALMMAQNSKEVVEISKQYQIDQQNRQICEAQLRNNVIPWACYRFANKSELKALDRKCEDAVRLAIREDSELLNIPSIRLSPNCFRAFTKAREIVHYRSDEIFSLKIGSDIEKSFSP